ncbi:hypothetical protein B5X24_HaOG205355 [Helicoverpa armigera]|uniref:Uncharacterized protein n=1 Tax=Helicoverpa armigera TaxID=29058 RepID=A0A2W1BVW6_HELAM|nr:hypothetical protein B5X24_HaOG205355 [Helicoverpa armigera]
MPATESPRQREHKSTRMGRPASKSPTNKFSRDDVYTTPTQNGIQGRPAYRGTYAQRQFHVVGNSNSTADRTANIQPPGAKRIPPTDAYDPNREHKNEPGSRRKTSPAKKTQTGNTTKIVTHEEDQRTQRGRKKYGGNPTP